MARRFPTPWREEKFSGGYVVRDATAPGVCTQNLEIKNKKPTTRFSTRQFSHGVPTGAAAARMILAAPPGLWWSRA